MRRSIGFAVATILATAPTTGIAVAAPAAGEGTWVSAWSAAPQGPSTLGALGFETFSGTVQARALQEFVPPPATFADQTIRQVMYLHHGGSAIRIRLSNEFGDTDAEFPSVTIGRRAGAAGAAVVPDTLRPVTFGGARGVTIPVGGTALSDPIRLATKAFDHLVLSIFVPVGNGPATVHGGSMQTFFTADGDRTADAAGEFEEHGVASNHVAASITTAGYYATGIQVQGAKGDKTLVAFGDSITDGVLSDGNTDTRYPDVLARRLKNNPKTRNLSVTNEAISGNRVTGDGLGPSAVNRLESQILAQPNLGGVIFLDGCNDLGGAVAQGVPKTAEEVIAVYKEISPRVRAKGVPVYIGTLTPASDLLAPTPYGVYSLPPAIAERQKVNAWLRTEGLHYFDGVIDFDAAVKNPSNPNQLDPQYDSLDHLHPNSKGYQAMAESIPQDFLDRIAAGRPITHNG